MDRGVFIGIEGIDGSGKTTQARLLVKRLKRSHEAVYTSEQSKGKIGRLIRRHYLQVQDRRSIAVEALLFAADRVEHLVNVVLPAMKRGRIVVSDRYVFSSLAYQGAAGLDLAWIETINKYAVRPDLTLFIDVEPEIALQRLKRARSVMENLGTQLKVREVYLKYVEKGELVRVDGNKSKSDVAREIDRVVKKFLKVV